MNRIALLCLLSFLPALGFAAKWYKGNTHVHTVLCGHADSTPEVVAQWYHDRGYNFLVLSEHNKFIDPSTVKLSGEIREDFLLVPGEEITGGRNNGSIHFTAMNTILNHPLWSRMVQAHEITPIKRLYIPSCSMGF